ncbi:MAG: winged helix-turn-helix domain-containing protein [Pseudooceanicola sp.]
MTGWPYDGDEIASRLRAYIRRSHGFASQAPSFGGLTVDLDRRVVSFGARSIHLTRLEYELVEMLTLADGRLVSRDAIMTRLYGWEDEPEAKIIDVYICRIRAKLATLDAPRGLIATRVGHGYRIDPFADTGWGAAA